MNTFLPTRRSLSSSTKKMSASFLRLAYGSIFALLLLMSGSLQAQILTFDFDGIAGSEASASSNSNDTNIASATITRGAGLTASGNGDRFNATNWATGSIANAVSGNKYMQFTITPNSGYQFNVSSMNISIQRSGTGFTQIALRSSVDGYASNLDAVKSVVDNTSTQSFTFTFTQANSSSAVTYRLYGYAEATGGSAGIGDFVGDDIVVNGAVSATCSAPTTTATAIAFSSSLPTSRTIEWTNGTTGTNRAVFVKAGTTGTPTVADNTTYTANTTFGSGTAAGAGWTCVYNGTGSSVNVTGLTASTDYRAMVVEYNCATGSEKYFTTATSAVNIDNFTTPSAGSPLITVSTASVTDFGSTCVGTNSTTDSYTVSGSNLVADIVITAPSHFEIKTGAGAYGSSVTLVPSSGTIATTTIDVRFSPSSVGAKTGDISHVSSTATTKNVSVSGTGSGGTVAVTTVTASDITTTTASSGGNTISSDCSATISAKGVVWGTSASPTVPSANSTSDGTSTAGYSSSIIGLTQNTLYHYRAYATNSNGVTGYGTGSTFTTVSKAPTAALASTATTSGFTASWTAPATQGSEAITYTVKVYSNNTFTTQVGSDITGISGTSTVVTGLSSSTTYYYTVAAVNAGGTSAAAGYTTGITTLSGPCFSINGPDFPSTSGFTGSGDTDSGGSPTSTIRLASGGSNGLISTTTTGIAAGDVNVKFRAKGWSGTEKEVTVTVGGVSQFINTLSTSFGEISLTFTSVSANPVIEFSTVSGKRVHIGNVNVYCIVSCAAPTVALQVTPVTSIATTTATLNGNVTAQGDFAINKRGFEYSVNSNMTASATKETAATTTGTYTENLTGLVANTVYYYRGYAVNDCSPNKTGYTATSSYPTFTTLHNAPTVGTGSGAAATSFTANWTAPTGGAAAFTYEIQVDNDSGFGSVDFTASGITGLSVSATGLSSSTTYYYRVRAVNAGGNSAWSSTSVGYATAAPDPVITYAVLQYPASHSMDEGNTVTVYGRVYAETVTEAAGASGTITAEVGYSTTNTNPNTWVNWTASTFNVQVGNDDEYQANIGTGLTPGTYYYATRFRIGAGSYVYGGTAGVWSSTANNGVLTINSNLVDYANYQYPATGSFTLGGAYSVYGKVYEPGITNAAGQGAGITAEAGYSTSNTNPNTWTNWFAATYHADSGSDDEYTYNMGPSLPAGGVYYLAFRYKKTGSTEYVYGGTGGIWNSDNATVTVVAPQEINIKQGATSIASAGTYGFGNQITSTSGTAVTFTIENTGGVALTVGALSKSGTDAGLFTITQPVSASVAASGTTTFTVVFSPTSLGAKTAQLSLVNNDGDENPYIINLTGTGTASGASDIVTDATFVYNTNIDYKSYITADISAVNSVELGRFTLRDGGATTDADNLGTIMSALSLTVGNSANLQKLAIYDGATEIAEVAAAGTTNFTGLTLTAADNGTKTFTIRGSFKTAVTDNQRITLTVASATASAAGSGFGTISATTSVTGNDNVIVVTANGLTFTTQPTTTGINVAMATVVVSATDSNANVDLDATGTVSIFSTGTLAGSPTGSLVSGSVSFSTLTHTVAQTGRTLFASATGLITGGSSTFDITEIVYVNGDFMTKTGGTWTNNGTGTATWFKRVGGVWDDTTGQIPNGTTGSYTVYITENLEVPNTGVTQLATSKIYITNNKTFTYKWSSNQWTFQNIIIDNGATLKLEGSGRFTTASSGQFEILNGGTFNYSNTSTLASSTGASSMATSLWNGTEVFHPNSNVVIGNHQSGASNYFLPASGNLSTYTKDGVTAYFGNLIFDAPVQDIRLTSNNLSSATTYLTAGNLEIRPYAITSGSQNLFYGGGTWIIGKNLVVGVNSTASAASASVVLKASTNSNDVTLNVKGNVVNLSTNTLNLTNATSGVLTLNLDGDLEIGANGKLESIASSTPAFNFTGTGDGTTDATTQTIDMVNASTANNILFSANSGSYVKIINQNLTLGSSSAFTVKSGGTFDFGFNGTTPLTISGPTFTLQTGGTIKITSADGITTSGATGNIRTTTRTIASGTPYAKFHYIGKGNQVPGNALPATVGELVVNNSGTSPTNEVTLSNALTANAKLQVLNGVLNLNGQVTQGNSSIVELNSNGILKITGTSTFPTGFTTHTFDTNSIVHYAGSNQAIAAIPSPANKYGKLKVSGTGIKTLATTDVQVGNTLEVTSSLLSIEQDKTLTVTNGITTSNDAISVANGGSLVQVTDVNNASANNNTGKIGVARITQPMYKFDYTYWSAPVGGTTLHDLSPDTPANRYFSWNPTAVSPAPNWSVITAGAGTMNAGTGYIIRAPNSYASDPTLVASYTAYSGSFSGVPNNGTVSTSVSGSDTVDIWNLLGNPYPSAIDAAGFLDANVGGTNDILGGTLYFWTHNTPYGAGTTYAYTAADYATWNGTGETATTTDTVLNNSNSPSGKIAAGQAFFVRGTANGTAVFKNTMREKGQNMQFFRGATTAETTTTVEKNRVWLNLKGANNAFSQTLVGYVTNATNDYDVRYDGESFGGNFVTFYSVNNGKNLVSQGRALPFVTTDEVPLGYKATGTGNLTIAIDHTDGALATQAIYLKDNVLNVVHDLTAGAYTFAAVAGTFNNRFVLRYLPAENLGNPTFDDAMNGVTIRKNDATLRINSPYETIDAVMVYDIMGRLVFEQKDCNTNTFEASHIVYSEQTLIVKVRLSNGGVVTKKVL